MLCIILKRNFVNCSHNVNSYYDTQNKDGKVAFVRFMRSMSFYEVLCIDHHARTIYY